MRLFQILNGKVTIVKDEQFYSDTIENYILDGGIIKKDGEEMLIAVHDSQQNYCEVNGVVLPYPDVFFENIIDGIDTLLAKKEEREYVEPTRAEIQKRLTDGVQNWMDNIVQERNYDNVHTCVGTYLYSPVEKFRLEAEAVRDWVSYVWSTCYEILAQVEAGERDIPTLEEVISELPILVW